MKALTKILLRFIYHGFALMGMVSFILGLVYTNKIMDGYNLSFRQLIVKAAQKAGVDKSYIQELIAPQKRHANHRLTGNMNSFHPRSLFSSPEQLDTLRERYFNDQSYRKLVAAFAKGTSRWVCSIDVEHGKNAIERLLSVQLTLPSAQGNYGNGFDIAFNYDLLYDHPSWNTDKRSRIHLLLKESIKQALVVLDEDSASMWHGRFQLACSNWVVASVYDGKTEEDIELISRSQAYFLDALEAISITGGWPEGYNYWINNRAYYFVMACLSHLNTVNDEILNEKIKKIIKVVGKWMILGTRPDGIFHLFGDSGPRNDLKDETQRVIDLFYAATGYRAFSDYSRYIKGLHGWEGYYRGYRQWMPLFQGLNNNRVYDADKVDDLSLVSDKLGVSELFGKGYFNQVFIRSGWKKEDTFISFRAGDTFTHHGHYKAGHFTIFKNKPWVISSGTYGEYTSPHRLNYYIRTVASNSILIVNKGECQKPNKFFKDCVAAGGQRIILPTGSAVNSVADFKKNHNKGRKYQGGDILVFDNSNPGYVYLKSDLTKAYHPDQAKSVIRELVYLVKEDAVVIHDLVESSKPQSSKKWLLHSWQKPFSENEKVLKGTVSNGIMETRDHKLFISDGQGQLAVDILLPQDSITRKIGGPDYRYYVETDGDDDVLDGHNMESGAREKPWFDGGLWRIEVQKDQAGASTEFLVVMKPSVSKSKGKLFYRTTKSDDGTRIDFDKTTIIFSKDKNKPAVFSIR